MDAGELKGYGLSAGAGALVWWVVLAFGFGWMTNGTAEKRAVERADAAVASALVPVCVDAYFRADNAAAHLAELKKGQSWNAGEAIAKVVKIPGMTSLDSKTKSACGDAIYNSKPATAAAVR